MSHDDHTATNGDQERGSPRFGHGRLKGKALPLSSVCAVVTIMGFWLLVLFIMLLCTSTDIEYQVLKSLSSTTLMANKIQRAATMPSGFHTRREWYVDLDRLNHI